MKTDRKYSYKTERDENVIFVEDMTICSNSKQLLELKLSKDEHGPLVLPKWWSPPTEFKKRNKMPKWSHLLPKLRLSFNQFKECDLLSQQSGIFCLAPRR